METDNTLQFRHIQNIAVSKRSYVYEWKLMAVCSTYGFAIFIQSDGWIDRVLTSDLEEPPGSNSYTHSDVINNYFPFFFQENEINPSIEFFAISFNCNDRVFAIAFDSSIGPHIYLYEAATLSQHYDGTPYHRLSVCLSGLATDKITVFEWNPTNSCLLAIATTKYLYTVLIFANDEYSYRILGKREHTASVTTVSWNATGTALTVGDIEGQVNRYNPKLKLLRSVDPPSLIPSVFENTFSCSGLCQVSRTQWIVVFTSETSARLHLMLLTLRGKKTPFWRVWDVLPPAADHFAAKTFKFLPVFGWDMVMMSTPCLTDVYTFGRVNDAWKPLELMEPFFIRTPLHNDECTFIVDVSINFSLSKNVLIGQFGWVFNSLPVVCVLTTNGTVLVYYLASLNPDLPNLCKPLQSIDYLTIKNGPTVPYKVRPDPSDEETIITDSSYDRLKCSSIHRSRLLYGFHTSESSTQTQDNEICNASTSALLKELISLIYSDISASDLKYRTRNFVCHRLSSTGKLSAYGVLETYASENEQFNQIENIKARWQAIFAIDTEIHAALKYLKCKLSHEKLVDATMSILDDPASEKPTLYAKNGLVVVKSAFSEDGLIVLKIVCEAMHLFFWVQDDEHFSK
uniref:Neuroblastoma-amplified sequence n=1 Tax=Panagrellus redivivus TaxID=6233 RepID=A0A7E4VUV2_PANRE